MTIFEKDGIKVEEYQVMPDGRKWYEVIWKTDHFIHRTFLTNVPVAHQNEADLLRLAKRRLQCL